MLFLQESCARMLLFRGSDKECLNYAGQTAYQVRQCDKPGGATNHTYIQCLPSPAKYSSEPVLAWLGSS